MKTTLHILILIFFSALVSCGQPTDKKHIPVASADTLETSVDKKEKERLERRKEIEEQEYADSIRLDKVLQDALKIANQNISKDKFIKKYEVTPDNIPVSVEINSD